VRTSSASAAAINERSLTSASARGDDHVLADVRSGHGCKRRFYLRPMIDYLVD
jgi:hypothetical protein